MATTIGYRALMSTGEMLRDGRIYGTRRQALAAATRWEARHPGDYCVETQPTGVSLPHPSDADGWDRLRSYGWPQPRPETT